MGRKAASGASAKRILTWRGLERQPQAGARASHNAHGSMSSMPVPRKSCRFRVAPAKSLKRDLCSKNCPIPAWNGHKQLSLFILLADPPGPQSGFDDDFSRPSNTQPTRAPGKPPVKVATTECAVDTRPPSTSKTRKPATPAPVKNPIANGQNNLVMVARSDWSKGSGVRASLMPIARSSAVRSRWRVQHGLPRRGAGSWLRKDADTFVRIVLRVACHAGVSATLSDPRAKLTWLLCRSAISRASASASITRRAPVRAWASVCAAII